MIMIDNSNNTSTPTACNCNYCTRTFDYDYVSSPPTPSTNHLSVSPRLLSAGPSSSPMAQHSGGSQHDNNVSSSPSPSPSSSPSPAPSPSSLRMHIERVVVPVVASPAGGTFLCFHDKKHELDSIEHMLEHVLFHCSQRFRCFLNPPSSSASSSSSPQPRYADAIDVSPPSDVEVARLRAMMKRQVEIKGVDFVAPAGGSLLSDSASAGVDDSKKNECRSCVRDEEQKTQQQQHFVGMSVRPPQCNDTEKCLDMHRQVLFPSSKINQQHPNQHQQKEEEVDAFIGVSLNSGWFTIPNIMTLITWLLKQRRRNQQQHTTPPQKNDPCSKTPVFRKVIVVTYDIPNGLNHSGWRSPCVYRREMKRGLKLLLELRAACRAVFRDGGGGGGGDASRRQEQQQRGGGEDDDDDDKSSNHDDGRNDDDADLLTMNRIEFLTWTEYLNRNRQECLSARARAYQLFEKCGESDDTTDASSSSSSSLRATVIRLADEFTHKSASTRSDTFPARAARYILEEYCRPTPLFYPAALRAPFHCGSQWHVAFLNDDANIPGEETPKKSSY